MHKESRLSADNALRTVYPPDHDPNYIFNTTDYIAYGLIQWCVPKRKGPLSEIAEKMGLPESDIVAQLACLRADIVIRGVAWNEADNIERVTELFADKIIESTYCMPDRLDYANTINKYFENY